MLLVITAYIKKKKFAKKKKKGNTGNRTQAGRIKTAVLTPNYIAIEMPF